MSKKGIKIIEDTFDVLIEAKKSLQKLNDDRYDRQDLSLINLISKVREYARNELEALINNKSYRKNK